MSSERELHQELAHEIPVAPLSLIVLPSAEKFGEKVNDYLVTFRREDHRDHPDSTALAGYEKDDYRIPVSIPRFSSGEAKAVLGESVRGQDVYILTDVTNHSETYVMNGFVNHKSPDDHFQDLKRVISALGGKAHRVNVIMPFLYEGRQHRRSGRESLDASLMLKELYDQGVSNFITFDAHDPRIQSVAPLNEFANFNSPYQFLRALMKNVKDLVVDKDHVVVISPDEGAMDRAIYFATIIGADTGMFYKRRDYSKIVGGKNPVVAHQFLGTDLDGKDAIIIDDMISSGGSILDTARQLKTKMHARRVFLCTTFGLFTDGLEPFDEAYARGDFDCLVSTNLTYQPPELETREWYSMADMSKYTATIIDFMNHDASMTPVSANVDRIHAALEKFNRHEQNLFDEEIIQTTEF